MYPPDNYPRLWRDPLRVNVQYIATIATVVEAVAAAASIASAGYAAAQGAPKVPDVGSSSRAVARAKAKSLPLQREIAAAEQQGGQVTIPIGAHSEPTQMVRIPKDFESPDAEWFMKDIMNNQGLPGIGALQLFGGDKTKLVPYKPEEWAAGGKYAHLLPEGKTKPKIEWHDRRVPKHNETYDFSGYGTADIQGELARKTAEIQSELGKKYGVQFAEEARREAELADPQGTAARKLENELIQKELANPHPINPLSTTLERQIDDQLKAGRGLDPMSRDLLDQAVARANLDRSGRTAAGDIETSLSTGNEGQARLHDAETKAQAFLSSGSSPEDIEYRREQQNLANLGAFVGGRTPESQFQNLSGASQGAAPFTPAQPGPQMPGGSAQQGGAYSVAGYQAATNAAMNQVNPWMAGLSSILSGVGAIGRATA